MSIFVVCQSNKNVYLKQLKMAKLTKEGREMRLRENVGYDTFDSILIVNPNHQVKRYFSICEFIKLLN